MYLVFDIGGTNMRLAVSSDGKSILRSKTISTPNDFDQGIQSIKQIAEKLADGKKIEKLAGGVAGPIDKDKTMLIASPHIGSWVNKPLKQGLEQAFNTPVLLEHEADLEGLAESVRGAGVGYKIVATLILGTGVASTRTVDGKIDNNSLGFEAGHQIIVADGNRCDCSGYGHLEAYVSGSGVFNQYGRKGEEIDDPQVWNQAAKYLAIGLNNVTVFWSPDVIILGGAVMQSISIEEVRSYFKEVMTIFPNPPQILPATLGEHSTFYGALELAKNMALK